jgi:hypothetical protein
MQVELTRKEIADLFFKTHSSDTVRMFRSFMADEEMEANARALERLHRTRERQQQQSGQEEHTE